MTVEVRLQHRFGDFSLDAEFAAGMGVTALFGPSGSGKSTVVNAVSGLLKPDAGRIVVGNDILFDSSADVALPTWRRRIGYVFQDARLLPHLTVRQNLLFGRWMRRRDIAAAGTGAIALAHVVDVLNLGHLLGRRPGALSGGEKQRVGIGRALLSCRACCSWMSHSPRSTTRGVSKCSTTSIASVTSWRCRCSTSPIRSTK